MAVIDENGQILDAGWTRGVEQTIGWADTAAGDGDAVMFVDAPLVVANETGQRPCETQVGQRYWRWKVSANTTNIHSPRLAGVRFLRQARLSGWQYSDAAAGRRPQAVSSRKPTRTPPWSVSQNSAMTPNDPATSASHPTFGPLSGGPSAPPTATR